MYHLNLPIRLARSGVVEFLKTAPSTSQCSISPLPLAWRTLRLEWSSATLQVSMSISSSSRVVIRTNTSTTAIPVVLWLIELLTPPLGATRRSTHRPSSTVISIGLVSPSADSQERTSATRSLSEMSSLRVPTDVT